jgi:hypothetical protein
LTEREGFEPGAKRLVRGADQWRGFGGTGRFPGFHSGADGEGGIRTLDERIYHP